MGEKIVIETAKAAKDLEASYAKVKSHAHDYGFSSVTALKEDIVKKAMTDAKKSADFVVELDIVGQSIIVQLVCDVKGKMRSVIGRKEIKDAKEWKAATSLAKNANFKNVAKQHHWD